MTVALDFDGVIHRYSQGWNGGTVYDPPMDGAVEAVKEIMAKEATFVFTARDPQQVCEALESWDLRCVADDPRNSRRFWNKKGVLLVTNHKYAARVYLDDRAAVFTPKGGWDQAMIDLGFREQRAELTLAGKIRELHRRNDYGECVHCSARDYPDYSVEYPCETVKILG